MKASLSRTHLLREVRKMRFEEAYEGWQERRLTQEEAGRLLGMSERNFRRYVGRYEADGLQGLIDRRVEQISHETACEQAGSAVSETKATRITHRIRGDCAGRVAAGVDLTRGYAQ